MKGMAFRRAPRGGLVLAALLATAVVAIITLLPKSLSDDLAQPALSSSQAIERNPIDDSHILKDPAQQRKLGPLDEPENELDVEVRGRVLDQHSAEGIPDVAINLIARGLPSQTQSTAEGSTGADGRFVLRGRLSQQYQDRPYEWELKATSELVVPKSERVAGPGLLRLEGGTKIISYEADVRLVRVFSIRGQVVAEDGVGVESAKLGLVEIAPGSMRMVTTTTSESDGHFRLISNEWLSQDLRIIIVTPGYLPAVFSTQLNKTSVHDQGSLRLLQGSSMRGIVAGLPVAKGIEYWLTLSPDEVVGNRMSDRLLGDLAWRDEECRRVRLETRIQEDGGFSVGGLMPGLYVIGLRTSGCNLARRSMPYTEVSAPADGVLVQSAVALLSVVVLDSEKNSELPLAGYATVENPAAVCPIDSRGTPVLLDASQPIRATVKAEGYQTATLDLPAMAPGEFQQRQVLLKKALALTTCTLRVTDPAGRPVPIVDLAILTPDEYANSKGAVRFGANSREDAGLHVMSPLMPGEYVLVIEPGTEGNQFKSLLLARTLNIVIGGEAEEIGVMLDEGGSVRAVVTDPAGKSIEVQTEVHRKGDAHAISVSWITLQPPITIWGGKIPGVGAARMFRPLPPATYEFEFRSDGFNSVKRELAIEAGKILECEVVLSPLK
jgi:hypothetical protein